MTAFVDTFYCLAAVNPRDPLHPADHHFEQAGFKILLR